MKARSGFRVQGEGKAQLITRMLIHSIQTHTTRHTYVQTFTHTHTHTPKTPSAIRGRTLKKNAMVRDKVVLSAL